MGGAGGTGALLWPPKCAGGHRGTQRDAERFRAIQSDAERCSHKQKEASAHRKQTEWAGPQEKRDVLCNVIPAAATGQNLHLLSGGSLNPGREQVGIAVWGSCSHTVQQENLYLLIHAPINQQSWAVAFACRMYREESIRKAWRKDLINLNENRKLQPPPAGVRSGGGTAPMLSCTVSGHHSYGESTRPERGEASRSISSSHGNDSQQQYHLCMPSTSGQ